MDAGSGTGVDGWGAWRVIARPTRTAVPILILLAALMLQSAMGVIGQNGPWPDLPDGGEYHPGDLVILNLGAPNGWPAPGQLVTIEVDAPEGDPCVLTTVLVPPDEGPVSLEYTLPSDCEPGTYSVFVCIQGPLGEGERHAGTFTVVLADEVQDPQFPMVAVVCLGAGGVVLAASAIVATGDASKYRFFALVAPLFTRLREDEVLTHEMRWKLLGFVTENPGESYNHIKRELNLPNGTLSYHIKVLERTGRVKCVKEGRYARFFTPEALRSGLPSRVLSDVEERIINTIHDNPRISQKEIALLLDEKPENLGYHLRKMVRAGWITSYTRGRETHYIVDDVPDDDDAAHERRHK